MRDYFHEFTCVNCVNVSINMLYISYEQRSSIENGKREKIYLPHIERIADALEIDDISEIIRLTKKE